jgi:hypothetical protein
MRHYFEMNAEALANNGNGVIQFHRHLLVLCLQPQ